MYSAIEKRKHKRIEKPYIVKLQTRPNDTQEMASGWDMVVAKDLGAGGLFFYSNRNLGIGTILDLKIGFSTSAPPIACVGTVLRIKSQPNTSIFGVAITFTKIDEQEKEMIDKTVVELSTQENQNLNPAFA